MPNVAHSIPNLINGISQQPPQMRQPTQLEEQVNMASTVVKGLSKRPPTEHIAKLGTDVLTKPFIHTINRSPTERYVVVITNGVIKVFDIAGNEKTVVVEGAAASYLASTDPRGDFRAVTVQDFSFIINKSTVVQKATTKSPSKRLESIASIHQGNYSTKYHITVSVGSSFDADDYNLEFVTSATDPATIRTEAIAAGLVATTPGGLQYTQVSSDGSTVWIRKAPSPPHTINAWRISGFDSNGDRNMTVIFDTVQSFEDLPTVAPDGYRVKVVGDAGSSQDDYYVAFTTLIGDIGTGHWSESLAPDIETDFDATTMPHVLIDNGDDTFTFRKQTWESRLVGDDDTNPFPSFTGATINDVFFHKNRLGFISGENVIMSEAGEFFNFFRTTVTTLLDGDPIDLAVAHKDVATLRWAIPFNDSILLFSDLSQFSLSSGNQLFTPTSAAVTQTTSFEASLDARPLPQGVNVYFGIPRGGQDEFSGVREFFVDPDSQNKDAADITLHVPKYLSGTIKKIAGCTNENILTVLTDGATDTLFIYKYLWQGNQKIQSAWSHWTFAGDVLNMDVIESDLFIVVQYEDGFYLEKMRLAEGITDEDSTFVIHTDRRVDESQVSMVYDSGENTTTITIPYLSTADLALVVRAGDGTANAGVRLSPTHTVGTDELVAIGDLTSRKFYIGQPFTSAFTFSQFYMREQAPGGGVAVISEGYLRVNKVILQVTSAGAFDAIVTPKNRDPYVKTYEQSVVGNTDLGEFTEMKGEVPVWVICKSDGFTLKIESDSYLPVGFSGAEWVGVFTSYANRG